MSALMDDACLLADLREAIIATLQGALGAEVDIAAHGGNFTESELARFMTKAPAVRVALLGFGAVSRRGAGYLLPVNFSAVVLTRDTPQIPRDVSAMALAAALTLAISGRCIGGCLPPEDLRGRAEYSGGVDKIGVALWQATWTAPLYFKTDGPDGAAQIITALSQIWVNGALTYADGALTGAEPPAAPPMRPMRAAPWPEPAND